MARFSGWTESALKHCVIIGEENKPTIKRKVKAGKKKTDERDYNGEIHTALLAMKIEAVREHHFCSERNYRIDVAVPSYKIGIEFQGGIWSGGRHVRGKGYAEDRKKINLAIRKGWKILEYTCDDARKQNWEYGVAMDVQELIDKAINNN